MEFRVQGPYGMLNNNYLFDCIDLTALILIVILYFYDSAG